MTKKIDEEQPEAEQPEVAAAPEPTLDALPPAARQGLGYGMTYVQAERSGVKCQRWPGGEVVNFNPDVPKPGISDEDKAANDWAVYCG